MTLNLEKITGTIEISGHGAINYEYYIKTRSVAFGLGSENFSDFIKEKICNSIRVAVETTPETVISYE